MPKYRITLSDGRTFQIEANRPPTEQEVIGLVGAGAPKPTAPAPTPASSAPPAGGMPEVPVPHTVLNTALGVLNTVPRVLEQGATSAIQMAQGKKDLGQSIVDVAKELNPYSTTTGETPLAALGMQPGLARTALGFGLDLAAPIGPVGKAAGLVGKGLKAGSELGMAKLAVKAPKVADELKDIGRTVQETFVQYPGMKKFIGRQSGLTAEDMFRLHESEIQGLQSQNRTAMAKLFDGIPEADRKAIADFINDPKANPLPANRPELFQVSGIVENMLLDQFRSEVGKGVSNQSRMIQDYFPWIIPQEMDKSVLEVASRNTTSKFSKERTLPDWATAKAKNAITDPAEAVQIRLDTGQRAEKTVDLLNRMRDEFGHTISGRTGPVPQGYRYLDLNKLKLNDVSKVDFADMVLPTEVADTLEKGHVIWAKPEGVFKLAQKANRLFKGTVTTFNPAHHATNLQGNIAMMILGDMSPTAAVGAYSKIPELHTLMGSVSSKLNPQQVAQYIAQFRAKPLTQNITLGEAFDAAKKFNLFGSSESVIEYNQALGKTTTNLGKAVNKVRFQTSRYIEDPAKWALFKDQLLKGKTPEQAAIHVKNFLFDYSELTPLERKLRDYGGVPFYAWMRKNIPAQLKSMVQTPQKARRLGVAYSLPDRIDQGSEDPAAGKLQWQAEEGYSPVPFMGRDEMGRKPMARLANPQLDVNKLASPNALLGTIGPIPRALLEGAFGRDLRTGRQILGTESGYVPAAPMSALAETISMKTGIPLPTGGVQPSLKGLIQPELAAFAIRQIPNPLVPYMQRIAGAPGETIGTELQTPVGRKIIDTLLQSLGMTRVNLTPEQEIEIAKSVLEQMKHQMDVEKIKATGAALRP